MGQAAQHSAQQSARTEAQQSAQDYRDAFVAFQEAGACLFAFARESLAATRNCKQTQSAAKPLLSSRVLSRLPPSTLDAVQQSSGSRRGQKRGAEWLSDLQGATAL